MALPSCLWARACAKVYCSYRASFLVWLAVVVFYVLGHLLDPARLAPRDWLRKSHADIAGARLRQWV